MCSQKLQKPLYYEQGFHLAFFGTPLFNEALEAWTLGPAVPAVHDKYRDCSKGGIVPGNNDIAAFKLEEEVSLFGIVFDVYGNLSANGLMLRTRQEAPWKRTEKGRGHVIRQNLMYDYFLKQLTDE